MGLFNRLPAARLLSETVRCEDCVYPCALKEKASRYTCEKHMEELINQKKVEVRVTWWVDEKLRLKIEDKYKAKIKEG